MTINIKKPKPDDGLSYKEHLKIAYSKNKISKDDYLHGITGNRQFYVSTEGPRKNKSISAHDAII